MCGEKSSLFKTAALSTGSPPRVRGKEENEYAKGQTHGITPACAGKSPSSVVFKVLNWDHPRVCGEKFITFSSNSDNIGSPPRVRGKGQKIQSFNHTIRITPACAGKRRRRSLPTRSAPDHPRVCGEKSISQWPKVLRSGSPPRVRGKGRDGLAVDELVGITPACAGKS